MGMGDGGGSGGRYTGEEGGGRGRGGEGMMVATKIMTRHLLLDFMTTVCFIIEHTVQRSVRTGLAGSNIQLWILLQSYRHAQTVQETVLSSSL